MDLLVEKAAIVTGSTSGIGLGIARALAKAGCNIMLNGFGEASAIERERKQLAKDFGIKAHFNRLGRCQGVPAFGADLAVTYLNDKAKKLRRAARP